MVPFTVQWFDGVPDFKITDPQKVRECLDGRLCGLCGTVMGKKVVFIGGDLSLTNGLFTDPPMHEVCARYAYAVCPFLNGSVIQMAPNPKNAPNDVDQHVSPHRPDAFGLLFAQKYGLAKVMGSVYIRAEDGRIEWL